MRFFLEIEFESDKLPEIDQSNAAVLAALLVLDESLEITSEIVCWTIKEKVD